MIAKSKSELIYHLNPNVNSLPSRVRNFSRINPLDFMDLNRRGSSGICGWGFKFSGYHGSDFGRESWVSNLAIKRCCSKYGIINGKMVVWHLKNDIGKSRS